MIKSIKINKNKLQTLYEKYIKTDDINVIFNGLNIM